MLQVRPLKKKQKCKKGDKPLGREELCHRNWLTVAAGKSQEQPSTSEGPGSPSNGLRMGSEGVRRPDVLIPGQKRLRGLRVAAGPLPVCPRQALVTGRCPHKGRPPAFSGCCFGCSSFPETPPDTPTSHFPRPLGPPAPRNLTPTLLGLGHPRSHIRLSVPLVLLLLPRLMWA